MTRKEFHDKFYPKIKNKYLQWWYFKIVWGYDLLPFYMDIPFTKLTLAIWNCGKGFKDLRITLRKDGAWVMTIKKGDYNDKKRVSKYLFK